MKLGIRLHLAGLSLSNTIRELEKFGVKRSRKAVHDWVQKADLQPADDANPDHIALDETVHGNRYAVERVFREMKRRTFHLVVVLATCSRRRQKCGCKPSPSGGIRLTKHGENNTEYS